VRPWPPCLKFIPAAPPIRRTRHGRQTRRLPAGCSWPRSILRAFSLPASARAPAGCARGLWAPQRLPAPPRAAARGREHAITRATCLRYGTKRGRRAGHTPIPEKSAPARDTATPPPRARALRGQLPRRARANYGDVNLALRCVASSGADCLLPPLCVDQELDHGVLTCVRCEYGAWCRPFEETWSLRAAARAGLEWGSRAIGAAGHVRAVSSPGSERSAKDMDHILVFFFSRGKKATRYGAFCPVGAT
jgi:hypothetical protein